DQICSSPSFPPTTTIAHSHPPSNARHRRCNTSRRPRTTPSRWRRAGEGKRADPGWGRAPSPSSETDARHVAYKPHSSRGTTRNNAGAPGRT
ncbi:hypothetical protein DXG01_013467, partial [Tephrocybe rancida]